MILEDSLPNEPSKKMKTKQMNKDISILSDSEMNKRFENSIKKV